MKKVTKKALVIAIIGIAVWILSMIIGVSIQFSNMSKHDFYSSPSPVPFLIFLLIGGLGFLTAVISGIIWLLSYLQDRKEM